MAVDLQAKVDLVVEIDYKQDIDFILTTHKLFLMHIYINQHYMEIKNICTFKTLDQFMEEHQKNSQLFMQLLEKKKKLLQAVDSQLLTAKKYQLICNKVLKEAESSQIKDIVEMEMLTLDGDDVEPWFQDVLEQTRDRLEDQEKIYAKLNKKEPKPSQKQQEAQLKSKTSGKESVQSPTNESTNIDPTKIFCFKALDSLMEENKRNRAIFMGSFQQKQKLIKLIESGKLNGKVYYESLLKNISNIANEDVKFNMQMEADLLKDLHDGNIEQWFKDVVEGTREQSDSQKASYETLKTGKTAVLKKQSDFGEGLVNDEIEEITKNMEKKVEASGVFKAKQHFCFKYIDDELARNQNQPKIFCELFQRKLAYLEMLKKQEIDAGGYRNQLQKIIEETKNDDLKMAAEMEIDLHDIGGDVSEFFEGVIEDTGTHYEDQEKKYNKFTNGKGKTLNLGSNEKPSSSSAKIKEQKPDFSDIVSFTVLVELLEKYSKDYDYCLELKEKGSKLMKLVDGKQLGSNQYQRFLETKIESSKNEYIVEIMKKELQSLQQSKDSNRTFKKIVEKYSSKAKVNLSINRNSFDSQIKICQQTVNTAKPEIKIEYLLRKFARYQSLLAYYKNNKMAAQAKDFEPDYAAMKKNTIQLCQKIKNNDVPEDFDVRGYVDNNLPEITFGILNRTARSAFNENIDNFVAKMQKSSQDYSEYVKKLKKSDNKNNIEEVAKIRRQIQENIEYLEGLKKDDFTPMPLIEEENVTMYNLDINKHLAENEIQIMVTEITGIKDSLILRIYFIDKNKPQFQTKVQDGTQSNVKFVVKTSPQIMADIIRGSDKKYLEFRLVSKGWFSESIVASQTLDFNFINSNYMYDTLKMKQGRIELIYAIKVQKPKRPRTVEIKSFKLTKYPRYEHSKFVENQFLKTLLQFEKPSQSEIRRK